MVVRLVHHILTGIKLKLNAVLVPLVAGNQTAPCWFEIGKRHCHRRHPVVVGSGFIGVGTKHKSGHIRHLFNFLLEGIGIYIINLGVGREEILHDHHHQPRDFRSGTCISMRTPQRSRIWIH